MLPRISQLIDRRYDKDILYATYILQIDFRSIVQVADSLDATRILLRQFHVGPPIATLELGSGNLFIRHKVACDFELTGT